MNLVLQGMKSFVQYGKHKVPRYIYHMTNKANYESMINDGMIKTTKDGLIGDGVFMTELTNLFKRWRFHKSWGLLSLQEKLLIRVAKGSNDIVILKIPTKTLNHELLRIRSQNKLFSWTNNKYLDIAEKVIGEMKKSPSKDSGGTDKFIKLLKQYLYATETKSNTEHLLEGISAKNSHLFKQRKEAIEYVYKENIPISNVEKIGEVNIADLCNSTEYDPVRPMRSIFTSLLKGTPELRGAELLNC